MADAKNIPMLWFSASGAGPAEFELELHPFTPEPESGMRINLGLRVRKSAQNGALVIGDAMTMVDGGFMADYTSVAELHRQLGAWLSSHPARFFECDDNGCVSYSVVAVDLDHAKDVLRKAGATFSPDETTLDLATGISWHEYTAEELAKKTRCHTEDERGVIPLSSARIGEWFCSEW